LVIPGFSCIQHKKINYAVMRYAKLRNFVLSNNPQKRNE